MGITIDDPDEDVWSSMLKIQDDQEVWQFVRPSIIMIYDEGHYMTLSVECECDWEEEHGLQMDFYDGIELGL